MLHVYNRSNTLASNGIRETSNILVLQTIVYYLKNLESYQPRALNGTMGSILPNHLVTNEQLKTTDYNISFHLQDQELQV